MLALAICSCSFAAQKNTKKFAGNSSAGPPITAAEYPPSIPSLQSTFFVVAEVIITGGSPPASSSLAVPLSQNRSEVSPRPSSSSSSLSDGNRHKARRPVMMVVALSLQAGHRSPRWLSSSPDGSEVCPQTGRRSAR